MEVTKRDILRHYLCSLLVYGLVLVLLFFMPAFSHDVENPLFSYLTVLLGYYILYAVFAYPILLKFKPESVLKSRNVAIVNYFKRQFKKQSPEERLSSISMDENEKQAFVILFIKVFFGSYFLSLLCNKYLVRLGYDFDFIATMWGQCVSYIQTSGFWGGLLQFLDDTTDMWLTLMFTVMSLVFAFSYLTESRLFKNNINYADTSFLGIFSCVICYYPFSLLTEKIIPVATKEMIPVDNMPLRLGLYFTVIIVNIIMTAAVLRLGTKSGNLTNRGIITGFPYNIVRHPEYSMRMFYIILTLIPLYAAGGLNVFGYIVLSVGMFMWIGIYVLRAITEERNLIKDESYRDYIQKVKYRFIPFVM